MKWEKQIVLVHLAHLMNALSVHLVWKQSSAPTCPKRNSEGAKNELVKANKSEKQSLNFILALEHKPVYTVGIRSKQYTKEEERRLRELGAEFHRTSRGGLITFHGPGQLVLYPICDIRRISTRNLGVRNFVDKLEQTIIDSATEGFGIHSVGRTENTGVWVCGERKLAAIGIAVSGGVSYHGIAINCNTDLAWFDNVSFILGFFSFKCAQKFPVLFLPCPI
uniref:lipoyl(octanoyl) transferase n=2 Tax=Caenorhabditis japonica TaxID=281687 RepID=A0A8R1ER92_CAEJA